MKENNKDKLDVITCPSCGCEYLPAEIYVPMGLVGKPKYVERDIYGKIINCYGKMWDPIETYTCDKCNTKFKIIANVKFNTKLEKTTDFSKDFSMKIRKPSLFLSEN